jgi:hypothetical protein
MYVRMAISNTMTPRLWLPGLLLGLRNPWSKRQYGLSKKMFVQHTMARLAGTIPPDYSKFSSNDWV